jgi:hypothetical protein
MLATVMNYFDMYYATGESVIKRKSQYLVLQNLLSDDSLPRTELQ